MLTVKSLTIAEPVSIDPVQRVVLRDAVIAASKIVLNTISEEYETLTPRVSSALDYLFDALDALDAAEGRK